MNKKLFILGGSVIGFFIFVIILLAILSSCSKKNSYDKIESKLVKAATEYVEKEGAPAIGTSIEISSDKLVEGGYIKSLDKLKNDNCYAIVKVINNGGILNYIPNLKCDNYKSLTLKEKIVNDNLTTKNAGLYYDDGVYIFRGKGVHNYIKVNNTLYRIIRIDESGDLKLIMTTHDKDEVVWDNKYNDIENSRVGENDYLTSSMWEYLHSSYVGYSESYKKHIIPKTICVGGRYSYNVEINDINDCSETLDNQYVSLILPSDYSQASLDKDCTAITNANCTNYNYMVYTLYSTWTLNRALDNSYQVVYYKDGDFNIKSASNKSYVQIVIYISGDELYSTGNGTEDNPYILKNVK